MKSIQKQLINKLLSTINNYPAGLFHGKMGLSIYLYHLSKNENNLEYLSIADQLLDRILLHDLSSNQSIDVKDGLAGIGLGVTYLVKNKFVEGNLNKLLEVIDNEIYRRIVFGKDISQMPLIRLSYLTGYLYVRLKDQTDKNSRILYQNLIIKVLNRLYDQIDDEFLIESYSFSIYHYQLPVLLWIISKLLDMNFYNDKIFKILDLLQLNIRSHFPSLHSNRLFLLWGMLNLTSYMPNATWNNCIHMLYHGINIDEILEYEMKERKIFISDGLSMIYILLYVINNHFPDYKISFNPQVIYDKLQNSDAWNALIERDYFYKIHQGLLDGFPGVHLVLLHIKQHHNLL